MDHISRTEKSVHSTKSHHYYESGSGGKRIGLGSVIGKEEVTVDSTTAASDDYTDLCSLSSVHSNIIKRMSSKVGQGGHIISPKAQYPAMAGDGLMRTTSNNSTTLDGAPWNRFLVADDDHVDDDDDDLWDDDGLRPPSAAPSLRPPSAAPSLRPPSAAQSLRPPSAAPSLRPPSGVPQEQQQQHRQHRDNASSSPTSLASSSSSLSDRVVLTEVFMDEELLPNVLKVRSKKRAEQNAATASSKTKGAPPQNPDHTSPSSVAQPINQFAPPVAPSAQQVPQIVHPVPQIVQPIPQLAQPPPHLVAVPPRRQPSKSPTTDSVCSAASSAGALPRMTSHELAALEHQMRTEEEHEKKRKCCFKICVAVSLILVIVVGSLGAVLLTRKPSSSNAKGQADASAVTLKIQISLDDHPEDTGWSLRQDDGVVLGHENTGSYSQPEYLMATVTHYVPIEPGTRCTFALIDASDNGIREGSYRVSVYTTTEVLLLDSDNGDFGPRVQFNLFVPTQAVPFPTSTPALVPFWQKVGDSVSAQQGGLRPAADYFGYSVALSSDGSVMAVGSPSLNNNAKGTLRVYRRAGRGPGSSWIPMGDVLRATNNGDGFAMSVSLSQDGLILAVGAEGRSTVEGPAGYVHVFEWDGDKWVPKGGLLRGNNDTDDSRGFGTDVQLSADGSSIVVGLSSHFPPASTAVRVFRFDSGNRVWVQQGDTLVLTTAVRTGIKVAIAADGKTIAAGVSSGFGTVKAYRFNQGKWSQIGQTLQGTEKGGSFGGALSLAADGSILAIGASQHFVRNAPRGYVQVYRFRDSAWSLKGSRIAGDNDRDQFGWGVALSWDGNSLAVTALKGGSLNRGFTRIYESVSDDWSRLGTNLHEDVDDGRFSTSVALSGDGRTVAVGATAFETTATTQGYVQVFEIGRNQ